MLAEIQKYTNNKKIISLYDEWNINWNVPLNRQVDKLHEDLIQIEFIRGYIMDIGWYPEHNIEGQFIGLLIRNNDWEKPIYNIETNNIGAIVDWATEVIELVFDFDLKH